MKAAKIGQRDEWSCWLCGGEVDPDLPPNSRYAGTVDHVVPRSRGGRTIPENLRLAHRICNSQRADSLPELDWPEEFDAIDASPLWSVIATIAKQPGVEAMAGIFPTQDRARKASAWAVEQACRFVGGDWTGWAEPTGHADLHVVRLRAVGAGSPGRPKIKRHRKGSGR